MFAGFLNSIADSVRGRVFASLENPRFGINDPRTWEALTAGRESETGINVTPEIALTLAPVWQAVSIISGDIASATAHVFKRMSEGDREVDKDHGVDYLLSEQPNEEMSAFELIRRFAIHLLLWQNGYLYVDRAGQVGRVFGLYNLLPDRTCPQRHEDGSLYYVTEAGEKVVPLLKEQVIHVKGLSIESGIGCELVEKARNSWGLALAAEGYGARFFKNGAQAGGIVELPVGMSETAQKNVVAGIEKKYTGKDNWFKTMVLRDGAKFHAMTIDAQKSQLTELREAQVRETARFFNLPPGKLGLEDSVSYNSAEQSQIQYITGCLTHWFSAIRAEFQLKLLSEPERRKRTHFIDFNTSKLIERDLLTTVNILAIERQNEIINAAEWRRKRDLPPRDDEAAFEYVNPNTKSNAPAEPAESEEPTEDFNAMEEPVKALLRDAVNRMARRVGAAARKSAKNGLQFEEFINTKAAEQHKGFDESILPVASVVAVLVGGDACGVCGELHMRFFTALVEELSPALDSPANQLEQNVQAACLRFESQVADMIEQSTFAKNKGLVLCP
jgi:HK97 family phage portal protein